jgi:hypothetical protein
MRKHVTLPLVTFTILSIVLAACASAPAGASDGGSSPPEGEGLPPVAAIKAREVLAAELSIALSEVTILSQEQTTWTDSCLGLGGPAESCLRADTPGWMVMLEANSTQYEARTDELGEQVRIAP